MQPVFLVTVFFCLLATVQPATGAALDATCTYTNGSRSDCADPNAICTPASGSKCQCKDGYQASGLTCNQAHTGATLDATCTYTDGSRSNCADANAICTPASGSKCQCKDGYQASGLTCTPTGAALNATCTYTDGSQSNCADANAICTPATGSKCLCKDGYQASGTACTAKNEGSAPGHLSIWMLCTTFLTMSLAVYVV